MDSIELATGIVQYNFPEKLTNKINLMIKETNKFDWMNSNISGNQTNTKVRSSRNLQIDQESILIKKTKVYLYECLKDYSEKYGHSVNYNFSLGLLGYEVGGEYKYHSDSNYEYYRTVSCLIYLNPLEYNGGETHFKFFNLKVKPDSPKVVLFPSNFIYTHAALPVTDGVKYVIVGWTNDVPEEVSWQNTTR